MPEVAGHLWSNVGRRAIGVHVHDLDVVQIGGATNQRLQQYLRCGCRALDEDAITRADALDCLFSGDHLGRVHYLQSLDRAQPRLGWPGNVDSAWPSIHAQNNGQQKTQTLLRPIL
jgi:hypothetical protein